VIRKESVVSAIIAVRLAIHPTPVDKIALHVVVAADIQNHQYSRQRGEAHLRRGRFSRLKNLLALLLEFLQVV
jgi:hypothetical protein